MQYNLPKRINSEQDLKYYENYLNTDTEVLNINTMEEYLKNKIGICVKLECLNSNKIGVVFEVGKDFLILRRQNNNTLVPFNQIKSVILPQGNQMHRQKKIHHS